MKRKYIIPAGIVIALVIIVLLSARREQTIMPYIIQGNQQQPIFITPTNITPPYKKQCGCS